MDNYLRSSLSSLLLAIIYDTMLTSIIAKRYSMQRQLQITNQKSSTPRQIQLVIIQLVTTTSSTSSQLGQLICLYNRELDVLARTFLTLASTSTFLYVNIFHPAKYFSKYYIPYVWQVVQLDMQVLYTSDLTQAGSQASLASSQLATYFSQVASHTQFELKNLISTKKPTLQTVQIQRSNLCLSHEQRKKCKFP